MGVGNFLRALNRTHRFESLGRAVMNPIKVVSQPAPTYDETIFPDKDILPRSLIRILQTYWHLFVLDLDF